MLQDIAVPELPETLTIKGHTLRRKAEFHITLTNPHKLAARIDESRAGVLSKALVAEFKAYNDEHPLTDYSLTNTFYFVEKDMRKTVVAMARVPALEGFFKLVRQKYGVHVPKQPAHVTLYALPPEEVVIPIRSAQELREMGTRIRLPELQIVPKTPVRTKFGNPILRQKAKRLNKEEILSDKIQALVEKIHHAMASEAFGKYGVGLAAPQVGEGVAMAIVHIKPTPRRPHIKKTVHQVMINPEITETYGRRTGMWEGCISCGKGNDTLYGKALRYKKVKLRWTDEHANTHEEVFEGLPAHVIQHEVDHLNGILFVDRVRDSKTFMMADEYRKRVANIK